MTLADCTEPRLIVPRLRARDAAGVIQELSRVLQEAGRLSDLLRFYHTALNRELTISSEVESGAAFPHGRDSGLTRVVFALGRCGDPIAWATNPLRSVRVVFLVAVPEGDASQYLGLALGLAHLARTAGWMERLGRGEHPEEILRVLREVPVGEAARSVAVPGEGGPGATPGGPMR